MSGLEQQGHSQSPEAVQQLTQAVRSGLPIMRCRKEQLKQLGARYRPALLDAEVEEQEEEKRRIRLHLEVADLDRAVAEDRKCDCLHPASPGVRRCTGPTIARSVTWARHMGVT